MMFNVDDTVKNNRTSSLNVTVLTVDFETFVEKSYTCDFNFAVLDSQSLFFVKKVTV